MALTNYEEGRILQFLFGRIAFTEPAIYHFGVSSTAPNDDGTGITEPSGGNYSRVQVPNITSAFTYTANQIVSGTAIVFPTSSASWGQMNYGIFFDQATGGTPSVYGSLSPSQTIDTNQQLRFESSGVIITLD